MSEFADYPVSLTEARASRTANCADWTPRDALIDLLREIDAGRLEPDALVIVYRRKIEDGVKTSFSLACPDLVTGLGLLSRAAWLMNED